MNIGSVNSLDSVRRYLSEMANIIQRSQRWRFVPTTVYTPSPLSTSTFTVTDDEHEIWKAGTPIKYRIAGVDYYGQIYNGTPGNGVLKIFGPSISGEIEAIWVGLPEMVHQEHWTIPGAYGQVAGDLNSAVGQLWRWNGPPAYLVRASLCHQTDKVGGTTNPVSGIYVGAGGGVPAAFASNVTVSTVPQSQGAAVVSGYRLTEGSYLSVRNSALDDGGTAAQDLNVTLVLILE